MQHITIVDNEIEVGNLLSWIADEQWHTFASEVSSRTGVNKRLQSAVGKEKFRVMNGIEIVYEGFNANEAVSRYNATVRSSKIEPKIFD